MISGTTRGRFSRPLCWLALGCLVLAGCGSDGGQVAGGGTGGTGISTGAVTGFGSVFLAGVEFPTGANTKRMVNGIDRSALADRDAFSVGMVVTIRHAANDNTATQIDYQDNLRGPVAAKSVSDNSIAVLGQPVVLDNADLLASLVSGDVVEVSGFADNEGRIRATYLGVKPPAAPGDQFEIKGFVSALSTIDNTFRLGPLPDGSGATVGISYADNAVRDIPGGPADGMYVEVTTADAQPAGGTLAAVKAEPVVARTDFPDGATVDLEGLVTKVVSRAGAQVHFEGEGKAVQASDLTAYAPPGSGPSGIAPNVRVLVSGTSVNGVVLAARVVFR